MYSLGIDVGSSSVKVSVLEIGTGRRVVASSYPASEAPIKSVRPGFAEQDPDSWWDYICHCMVEISARMSLSEVRCIGISYQMHGLVALDADKKPVRDAIIWCDSRAVGIGEESLGGMGYDRCMSHLLNSPGNFTASKLAWVKRNEPELYSRIERFMLPGDYVAYKLCGEVTTTASGLSEGIFWDFLEGRKAGFVQSYFGFDEVMFPETVPSIGADLRTKESFFGIPAGTPVSYRAGDQPNNAFSLNVLNPGEIAATGGTSGVVYGVTDVPKADPLSRVNTFLHVNSTEETPRYGVLLCINGTGILNSWLHRNVCPELGYDEMNRLAASAPAGSDGLLMMPFGNGAERVLCNSFPGAGVSGLDLVRHSRAHLLRAAQEGIACSFRYGIDIMKNLGLVPDVIRAGNANLFLSPLFKAALATVTGARIEIFDTDGSLGAARGAALGAGYYTSAAEAFTTLEVIECVDPVTEWREPLEEAWQRWCTLIEQQKQQ